MKHVTELLRQAVLSTLFASSFLLHQSSFTAEPRPNILLIVSEDNGPELGCYGDPCARTPHLDRLAGEGIRFDRAFVAQAGCSQSRASFLTGLYPHQHGQIGLATWGFRMYREDTPNLPRNLKAAGYRTGLIGKLHVNPESAFPFDFHEITGANFARKNLGDYARHAEAFITAGDEPFFLSVNYPDAHSPWLRQVEGLPAEPQSGAGVKAMPYIGIDPPGMREIVADYYNSLSRLDSLVGDLLAALARSGKADNTLVIYIGDHGADFLRGKRTSYEGGLRIPMLLRWPSKVAPQTRADLVSSVDLMPTVLAAAGAPAMPELAGQALQPLFQPGAAPWREHLFAEFHTHAAATNFWPQRSVRTARHKLIENLLPGEINPGYESALGQVTKEAAASEPPVALDLTSEIAQAAPVVRAAFALSRQPPRFELYDLETDPYEFQNLADNAAHQPVLDELKQALQTWREQTRDPLLDEKNLQRLKAEIQAVKSKASGKQLGWAYPDYFFGREPATKAKAGKKSKKAAKGKKKSG